MLSVGVDLVHIPRIQRALERFGTRFLERIYTPAEALFYRGRLPELAARFAAKEAVSKALGVGMRVLSRNGIYFRDVEVLSDINGKPHVMLHGRAAQLAAEQGLTHWAISMSHEHDTAIALVVAQ